VKFTVTMECEGCGEKFVGQAEHLVDAVTGMVGSAAKGDHAGGPMNLELEALAGKAGDVNAVGSVLEVLGLNPSQVVVMDTEELRKHLSKTPPKEEK
jgi:hypothetical protein